MENVKTEVTQAIGIGFRQCAEGLEAKLERPMTELETAIAKYAFASGGVNSAMLAQKHLLPSGGTI